MIELRNVDFHYCGENGTGDGVDALDLTIADGECVVLCGESGCGKTTVTRLINGLIPHFYEGELIGEVFIDGHNVSASELSETAALVGSVFRNPKSQFFNIDTTGELTFGCENLGMSREDIGRRLDKNRRDMKLDPLMNRNISELSGGEKQQIACGSVYTTAPRVFVMDEPSSNLDKKAINRLHDIMAKIKRDGRTIVVSEHRIHYLMDIADRFIYMNDGRIVHEYTADQMKAMTEDELSELGLRCTSIGNIAGDAENAVPQNSTPALDVIDLSCSRGNSRILDADRIMFPENSIVAVVGHSGSGKSTLAKLLVHYYDIRSGSISIGGQDIRDMSQDALNSRVAYVSQEVFLFNKTIMENIRAGRKGASDEEVIEAAKKAECDEFIRSLPQGYDTPAGAARNMLSGGQKQRIAFARAILKDAPIIILDEATAFVDAENEAKMRRAMGEIMRGKTVIVIAHKLRSVKNADKIIVLDGGRIAAEGTHDELTASSGEYRRLWAMSEETREWTLKKEVQAV